MREYLFFYKIIWKQIPNVICMPRVVSVLSPQHCFEVDLRSPRQVSSRVSHLAYASIPSALDHVGFRLNFRHDDGQSLGSSILAHPRLSPPCRTDGDGCGEDPPQLGTGHAQGRSGLRS